MMMMMMMMMMLMLMLMLMIALESTQVHVSTLHCLVLSTIWLIGGLDVWQAHFKARLQLSVPVRS
eukprot:4566365-Amphidinium_carterae.1